MKKNIIETLYNLDKTYSKYEKYFRSLRKLFPVLPTKYYQDKSKRTPLPNYYDYHTFVAFFTDVNNVDDRFIHLYIHTKRQWKNIWKCYLPKSKRQ